MYARASCLPLGFASMRHPWTQTVPLDEIGKWKTCPSSMCRRTTSSSRIAATKSSPPGLLITLALCLCTIWRCHYVVSVARHVNWFTIFKKESVDSASAILASRAASLAGLTNQAKKQEGARFLASDDRPTIDNPPKGELWDDHDDSGS
jgi:hypothetical protein